jgi:cobalt-zinc-cadmium efflux system outer membrane protein
LLLQSNPTLAAEAGPRDDPSVKRGVEYSFQLLQQVEVAGQRGVRMEAATAALDATDARLRALRVDLTARVRESFGRVVAAQQWLALSTEALAVAQQGLDAVDARFRAGAIPSLELNTARGELGRAIREKADAERRRAEALAGFRLLIGLDPSESIDAQGESKPDEALPDGDEVVAQALANRAELEEARRDLASAEAEAKLAARAWIPSPRLGTTYRYEGDTNTTIVLGVVQVDLPVFNRNVAARGTTDARVDQLRVAIAATERRVKQEALTALERVRTARAAAKGYAGDVVKGMQQNIVLVTESYRAGKIDFLQLVVIRRQAIDTQREYIDVLEELNAAEAQLGRTVGRAK